MLRLKHTDRAWCVPRGRARTPSAPIHTHTHTCTRTFIHTAVYSDALSAHAPMLARMYSHSAHPHTTLTTPHAYHTHTHTHTTPTRTSHLHRRSHHTRKHVHICALAQCTQLTIANARHSIRYFQSIHLCHAHFSLSFFSSHSKSILHTSIPTWRYSRLLAA